MKDKLMMSVRIKRELHAKARAKAALRGVTLSAVVRDFLERWASDMPEPELEKRED